MQFHPALRLIRVRTILHRFEFNGGFRQPTVRPGHRRGAVGRFRCPHRVDGSREVPATVVTPHRSLNGALGETARRGARADNGAVHSQHLHPGRFGVGALAAQRHGKGHRFVARPNRLDRCRTTGHTERIKLDRSLPHALLGVAHGEPDRALAARIAGVGPRHLHGVAVRLKTPERARVSINGHQAQPATRSAGERIVFTSHPDERGRARRANRALQGDRGTAGSIHCCLTHAEGQQGLALAGARHSHGELLL